MVSAPTLSGTYIMLITGEILRILAGPCGFPEKVGELEQGGGIEVNQVQLQAKVPLNSFSSHTLLINQEWLVLSALKKAENGTVPYNSYCTVW